jgi:hypothetical protein
MEKKYYVVSVIKAGTLDEWEECPVRAETPEGVSEIVRMLVHYRKPDCERWRIEVRIEV